MKKAESVWLIAGYEAFALEGPFTLKIEKLAKRVSKNKSSFYHLFSDIDLFKERLLDIHLDRTKVIAEKESKATNAAELIQVILEHKIDFLFNRQLRIHRGIPEFYACFQKSAEISITHILPLWKKLIGLPGNSPLAEMVLQLSLENFYLQITDDTLNSEWLNSYLIQIQQMVQQFKTIPKPPLDGTD